MLRYLDVSDNEAALSGSGETIVYLLPLNVVPVVSVEPHQIPIGIVLVVVVNPAGALCETIDNLQVYLHLLNNFLGHISIGRGPPIFIPNTANFGVDGSTSPIRTHLTKELELVPGSTGTHHLLFIVPIGLLHTHVVVLPFGRSRHLGRLVFVQIGAFDGG